MDEEDIFKKLTTGLHFKKTKNVFNVNGEPMNATDNSSDDISSGLDFFKRSSKKAKVQVNHSKNNHEVKDINTSIEPALLKSEENSRKKHKINVVGSDVPDLVVNFDDLRSVYDVNTKCIENVFTEMQFKHLTPIQMQAIPAMIHRRDILACAPTGSGKTLSFVLPTLHLVLKNKMIESNQGTNGKNQQQFQALIIVPTRELAAQILNVFLSLSKNSAAPGVKVKLLDKSTVKSFERKGAKYGKQFDILISTPNRILHLFQQDIPLIHLSGVETLVVDECDKLFEEGAEGRSFREQLGTIYSNCTNPKISRGLFSATFSFDVQQWCIMNMNNILQITIGGKNTAVMSVQQELNYVGNEQGKHLALAEIFHHQGFLPPAMIFVQSKERAKELFQELIYDGMNIDVIHSDQTESQRKKAIENFRTGKTWVLICTDLMGRGMDFKGINLVINYDFPTSAISYIHRVGRTGRAGRSGKAVTLFTDDDKPLLRNIVSVVRGAGCHVPEYMLKLKKLEKDEAKRMSKMKRPRKTIRTAPLDLIKEERAKREKLKAKRQAKLQKNKKVIKE